MRKTGIILLCLTVLAVFAFAEGKSEQDAAAQRPKGPVQIVVGAKAGGGTDLMARIFSDYLQRELDSPLLL